VKHSAAEEAYASCGAVYVMNVLHCDCKMRNVRLSQVDGRRAPVVDLLANSSHSTSDQPSDSDNVPAETIYIPAVDLELDGGISSSPPAILDNWLQLQQAHTLESLDNGIRVMF